MKILDSSASMMWRIRQENLADSATGRSTGPGALESKLRELHQITTTTRPPAQDAYYAAGRKNLKMYEEGFQGIQDFGRGYSSVMKNARLTDKEIVALIERMNLTPR